MTVRTPTQIPSRSPENTQFQNIEKRKDIDLQPMAPEWHASPARWGPTARALLWCDGKLPQSLGHSNRGHNWLQTTRCHPWMLNTSWEENACQSRPLWGGLPTMKQQFQALVHWSNRTANRTTGVLWLPGTVPFLVLVALCWSGFQVKCKGHYAPTATNVDCSHASSTCPTRDSGAQRRDWCFEANSLWKGRCCLQ